MSLEHEGPGNQVTLRDYIERIFDERKAALDIAFKAQQDALALARESIELRLEKLNELRQEVVSDRGNYITRDKYEADMKANDAWRNQIQGGMNLVRFLGAAGAIGAALEVARIAGAIK